MTAKELALSKNRKCISDSYINNWTLLLWECEKFHQWKATLNSIKNSGHWCQNCAGTKKLNFKIAEEVVISKHEQCLLTEYINIDKPLL